MEGGQEPSKCIPILVMDPVLTSFLKANHLEMMMRDQLVIQEEMDCHLNSRDEELCQLFLPISGGWGSACCSVFAGPGVDCFSEETI